MRGRLLISPEYLALQKQMHARGNYGLSGGKWADDVHLIAGAYDADSVLDYGCGQGTLAGALPADRQYAVAEYDPAIPGKERRPFRADIVFCGDVLEHIEPRFLEDVLDDLQSLAKKVAVLVVATRPAAKHLPDGRNAHLIVQEPVWWLRELVCWWHPRLFNDGVGEFLFVGEPLS